VAVFDDGTLKAEQLHETQLASQALEAIPVG
jgi:hypothetical protein